MGAPLISVLVEHRVEGANYIGLESIYLFMFKYRAV